MSALKNKGTAIIITVIMVSVSVFGIGGFKLRSKVNAVEQTFYEKGGISDCINQRADAAANIVQIAMKLPDAKAEAEIKDLNQALEQLGSAKGPEAQSLADRAVEDAEFALVEAIQDAAAAQGKDDVLTNQDANFVAAGGRIRYAQKDYNSAVDEVNRQLHGFPASIIRLFVGAGEAEYCK